jgi:hypothetical protein
MHVRFIPLVVACVLVLSACKEQRLYVMPAASAADASSSPAQPGLVLPPEVDLQVAETFVKIAYGLNEGQRFQSTEFLTPRLRTSQAAPLIRLVKHYNEFDGERVANAVSSLKGRVSGVEFGREGSPVLYIELPFWTHQREGASATEKGIKIDDAQSDALANELRALFVDQLKADEFSVNRRRVRVWWD